MKRLAKRLLLICFVVFFSLLMFEIFLQCESYWHSYRSDKKGSFQPQAFTFFEYDPLLGWRNRPLKQGSFQTNESISQVSINQKGLRGKEYPYERSQKPRILVLGDSFVWGYGVEEKERFTDRLETLFQGKIEVVNAGVPGYGLDQFLLFLETEGKKYRPDLVVCAVNEVDFADISYRVNHGYSKPYFMLREGSLHLQGVPVPKDPSLGKIQKRIWTHCYFIPSTTPPQTNPLLSFLEERTVLYPFIQHAIQDTGQKTGGMVEKEENEFAKLLFQRMRKSCEAIDAEMVVLLAPISESIRFKKRLTVYQNILHLLRSSGYTIIDPYDRLVASSSNEMLYFRKDGGHWTSAGHRVIAEGLYDFLVQKSQKFRNIPGHYN